MMGQLARTDAYYDPFSGSAVMPPEKPFRPEDLSANWAYIAAAHPEAFEPQGTMWPDPNAAPKPAPRSPGEPGYQWSIGQWAAPFHGASQAAGETAASMLLPGSRTAMVATSMLDSDPAEGASRPKAAAAVKAVAKAKDAIGEILRPDNIAGTVAERVNTAGWANAPYLKNPVRVAYPGIYGDPREIAANAAAQVAPEHPALKELFGVTRQDLYDIGQQGRRQGNIETKLWTPDKPRLNEAAQGIMTPANAQRLIDANAEALKYPALHKGMDAWYVMDPMYQRMVQLVGPERAAAEYRAFNATVPPFSAATEVPVEITRGTAANMFRQMGRYPEFLQYGGMPPSKRLHLPELADVPGHAYHSTAQARPVANYIETGSHGYAPDTVKVPLYIDASGVPQTGFQTRQPVPDAHFTRAVGMSDTRTGTDFGKFMGGTEYREAGPWFREHVAKPLGIEAVPAQARTWGVFSPITGVDTPIGAPKLELFSKQIWERAKKLGVDPRDFRDQVLRGEQHSELEDDNRGMGTLAALNKYA